MIKLVLHQDTAISKAVIYMDLKKCLENSILISGITNLYEPKRIGNWKSTYMKLQNLFFIFCYLNDQAPD
jgi:hypothetical protein